MANSTTVNKQNKLLLSALVVILAASAILVAVTGSANKKKADENPPLEKQEENVADSSEKAKEDVSLPGKTDSKNDSTAEKTPDDTATSSDKDKKDGQTEVKQDKPSEKTEAITEEVVETAVQNDVLPKFVAPVDSIVIKSASLATPVFSYTMNDYRTHGGLDFACSTGTPVCAAADGLVTEVSDDPMMGVTVVLSHSGGAVTKYKGLAEETLAMLAVGDEVKSGDVIGVSGDTALIESAEENHVHFELSVNGEQKDPAEYMSVVFLSDLTED